MSILKLIVYFCLEFFLNMVGGLFLGLKKEQCPKCGKLSPRSWGADDIYKCPEHGEWICKLH